ncbi:TrmB family transcriptional regulator [Saliphagus sp. LR7]|uniref:TrmB family transcriptional regulator n=1 Tax=Saliphagus sp. LR7 TaxID=2282654 RepID=UPI000DF84096|nr:helix-turn-helix domain-containing protein [Saliphagus sp. LR7]
MAPTDSDRSWSTAVDHLEALGLSTYAAQTFVALQSLGEGTAREVSDIASVPRTRVYDAAEELQSWGLVDVQQSTPKRFWAVSSETTGRRFESEVSYRVDELVSALNSLGGVTRSEEQQGVWTVSNQQSISDRVIDFIENAEDELVYMTVGALLTDALVEALRDASERGVTIRLGAMSPEVEDELADEIPEAEFFETLWVWSDTPAGRLFMADETKTLVSVLVPDSRDGADGTSGPPEEIEETAIWGSGATNSLVVVLKAMFTWQLNGNRD